MKLNEIAKAIVGAATAASATLGVAVADGHISAAEYVIIITGTIVAFWGVWATTNAPASK